MFSIFPELLFLAPLGAFFMRAAAAAVFAAAAYNHTRKNSFIPLYMLAALEMATSLSLAMGVGTQVGALGGLLIGIVWLISPRIRPYEVAMSLIMLAVCASILVTGAGAFAFDLPL